MTTKTTDGIRKGDSDRRGQPRGAISRRGLLGAAVAAPLWAACASTGAATGATAAAPLVPPVGGSIRLLVRADDMGSSHGANVGIMRSFRDGIARSLEVIVPGPWFPEAVRLLKENPTADVGIHLCLTAEWENVKWRPVTHAPTLSDSDGFLYPTVRQRKTFPPNTALLDVNAADLPRMVAEAEAELRAQIELLKKHVPRLSHVSAHMGAASATPELRAVTEKLVREYGLTAETQGLKSLPFPARVPGERHNHEARLVAALSAAGPGDYIFVEHPATDDAELRAIGHIGYEDVAADRSSVTAALTSARVKDVIARRKIALISYADLRR